MRTQGIAECMIESARKRKGIKSEQLSRMIFGSVNQYYNRRRDIAKMTIGEFLELSKLLDIADDKLIEAMRKEIG